MKYTVGFMDIHFYNYWNSTRELEWNFSFGRSNKFLYDWSFRFGTHQIALWHNAEALFNFSLQKRTEIQSVKGHGG